MVFKLNILHLLIALGAAGCAGVLVHEAHGRLLRPSRLAVAPLLAAVAALFLLALVAPEDRAPKLWAVALALGALPGAVRGLVMPLEVDHTWALLRLPRGRDGLWTAAALAVLSVLAIVLSLTGDEAGAATGAVTGVWEVLSAAAATGAAGYLGGRALTLFLRTAHAPHSTLARAGA
ncbi:MAG: hypothetical protein PSV46_18100 [Reyranella sp.]|nr:hypothetical protein [Reyranella sp.]